MIAHGTERRRYKGLVRCSESTHQRLREFAEGQGITMAEALDRLVPRKRLPDNFGVCLGCQKRVKNPRGRHNRHDKDCHLWAAKD